MANKALRIALSTAWMQGWNQGEAGSAPAVLTTRLAERLTEIEKEIAGKLVALDKYQEELFTDGILKANEWKSGEGVWV